MVATWRRCATRVWISTKRVEKARPTMWQVTHLWLRLYAKQLESSTIKCELLSYSWNWRTQDVYTVNWRNFLPLPAGCQRLQHSVVRLSLLDHRQCCNRSNYIRPLQWEFPTRVPGYGSWFAAVRIFGHPVRNPPTSFTHPETWTHGTLR